MPKRRTSTALAPRTTVVRFPPQRQAAPIVIRQTRAAPKPKRRSGRRRGGSVGGGGAFSGIMGNGLGGFLFGILVKQGMVDKLPAIPVVGRTGTAAIVLDYFAKRGGGHWARQGAMAAAVLAGYQLGSEGSIHGDEDASPDEDD